MENAEHFKYSLRKDTDYIWIVMGCIVLFGLISAVLSLTGNGFRLSNVLSLKGLLNASSTAAVQRYTGTQNRSLIHQLLSVFVYLSAVCGGYIYNYAEDKKSRFFSVFALFPIICEMLFTSGKVGFIASVFLWFAGWCTSYIRMNGSLPNVKPQTVILLLLILIIMAMLLFLAMILRVGTVSENVMYVLARKFWIYAFGQMVEFDGWFSTQAANSEYQFGINTYMMVFRILGLADRPQGVYEVYVPGYGNIFTAFRGIINDFGVLGSLLYCFVRGMITQLCLDMLVSNHKYTILSAMLFVCAYLWNLYSFIISPWIYTTYFLAIIGFGCFLLLLRSKSRYSHRIKLSCWR